ncbi:hypothetical protein SARC_07263 [Sphaeroforma arctica JP610]|uniref:Amino acid transporter transmembrane domain-containing protein n=1 Tax=Sphaeroforma arctica JP610 TaxID=667725 RepID=A0A0L0FU71_9EUKA|nr:hypothetical protein SARC_07263 [Sphaeroforma arctica JP610]KNC80377.1 hypothetical protein SARC_07263 [Sphaeroforma arctica JP610]|eukprot:XP_014154279.1 hypothetical protein SARC_07263 [Sphaeroforma arctica JP610]
MVGVQDIAMGDTNTVVANHKKGESSVVSVGNIYTASEDASSDIAKGEGQASFVKTVINIVTVTIGVGMMSMPLAFAQSGWLFAITCVFLAGTTSMYTGHLLGVCLEEANEEPGCFVKSYTELGFAALKTPGEWLAGFGIYGTCLGTSVVFIILAENMFGIIFGPDALDKKLWALVFVGLLFPFTSIKTLNHVAVISFAGALASVMVFLVVVIEDITEATIGGTIGLKTDTILFETENPMQLATAATTIVFSFAAHIVFPESYLQMSVRSTFSKAVVYAFSFALFIYLTISCVSYGVYGADILNGDNILDVLPNNWATKMMAAFLLVHLVTAFLVILNPVYRAIELAWGIDDKPYSLVWMMTLRILIIGCSYFVAVAIPFFSSVMSLLGATTITVSTFTCPCLFYLKLFWPKKRNADPALSVPQMTLEEYSNDAQKYNPASQSSASMQPSVQRRTATPTEIVICLSIIAVTTFIGALSTYQSIKNIVDNAANEKFFG